MDDLEPTSAPKPNEAKPKITGRVSSNQHKAFAIDLCPVSGCFDRDAKLLNREIAGCGKYESQLWAEMRPTLSQRDHPAIT